MKFTCEVQPANSLRAQCLFSISCCLVGKRHNEEPRNCNSSAREHLEDALGLRLGAGHGVFLLSFTDCRANVMLTLICT